jgi:hypothetical protein
MMPIRPFGPVPYCSNPHGHFRHVIDAAGHAEAGAVMSLVERHAQRTGA